MKLIAGRADEHPAVLDAGLVRTHADHRRPDAELGVNVPRGNVDPHIGSPRRTYCSFKTGSERPSSGSWPSTSPTSSGSRS
jgi:hypothetical protein